MYTHLQLRDSTRPPVSLATLGRMKEQGEKIARSPVTTQALQPWSMKQMSIWCWLVIRSVW